MASTAHQTQFFHQEQDGCTCPIHRNRTREPFTAPLGMRFADHVSVREIPQATAAAIYEAHHSYKSEIPDINLSHHGIYYQGQLLGALTYRFPLLSKKAVYFDQDGAVTAPPIDIEDELPEDLVQTGREVIPDNSEEDIARREVFTGDEFVEVARICLGERMANLASAALARSMDLFARSNADHDVRFLMTFVRADFQGSMIRALRDRGWRCVGFSEPSEAGNRDQMAIRKQHKWQFLADLHDYDTQTALAEFSKQ